MASGPDDLTHQWAPSAPLATQLIDLAASRPVRNFSAPSLSTAERDMSAWMQARYQALFRGGLPHSDVNYSGQHLLDSFFAPTGPLAAAQTEAAESFGAAACFFGSCGTTTSNRIVVHALARPDDRVLVDGASHPSVPFALRALGADMDVVPPVDIWGGSHPDVEALCRQLAAGAAAGRPYAVVAVAATSQEGYLLRMPEVLPALVEASPHTAVLVDDAWGGIYAFSKHLAPLRAPAAVESMRASGIPVPPVVMTVSAHKSMCALRQGSYILALSGGQAVQESLRSAVFTMHTTSPSWPVLASLDLACEHARLYGQRLVERSLSIRDHVRDQLLLDPRMARLVRADDALSSCQGLVQDPMKLTIAAGPFGGDRQLRSDLLREHGIYISRCSPAGMQLNFHIGVSWSDGEHLVTALRDLLQRAFVSSGMPRG